MNFIILILFFFNIQLCSSSDNSEDNWETEIPKKTLQDICGLKEIKKDFYLLKDYIASYLLDDKKFEAENMVFQKGFLIEGKPGNAKTEIVRAFAGEMGLAFNYINPSQFGDTYVNSGAIAINKFFDSIFAQCGKKIIIEKGVREVETEVEVEVSSWFFWKNKKIEKKILIEKILVEKLTPVIVFIDELDAIGSRNTSNLISENKTILALTTAIDKINQKNLPIWFFAATNSTTNIDPALIRTGRFGGNRFIILDPDKDTVKEMIGKNKNFITCAIPKVIDPLFFKNYSNIRLDHNLITKFNREEDEEKKGSYY